MTNHVHLIAVPEHADSLRLALQRTQSHYAQYFNRRYGRSGHLWQARFFSCPLGRDYLITALAYVDLNPVRAHLVGRAEQYPWSSAAAHLAGHPAGGLIDLERRRETPAAMHWADALETPSGEHRTPCACAGLLWPVCRLGGPEFDQQLEQACGRRLMHERPGRRPRAQAPPPDFGLSPRMIPRRVPLLRL